MAHLTPLAAIYEPRIFEWPQYEISGVVKDITDAPVAGRTVLALREDRRAVAAIATTAADGSYTLRTAYAGPHTLVFSGEPYCNALVLAGVVAA